MKVINSTARITGLQPLDLAIQLIFNPWAHPAHTSPAPPLGSHTQQYRKPCRNQVRQYPLVFPHLQSSHCLVECYQDLTDPKIKWNFSFAPRPPYSFGHIKKKIRDTEKLKISKKNTCQMLIILK